MQRRPLTRRPSAVGLSPRAGRGEDSTSSTRQLHCGAVPEALPCGAGRMNRFARRRPRLRRIVLGVTGAVCCAALGLIGRARAERSGAFTFAWSAPEACASQQQVEAEIARLVGGDPRLRDGNDLQATVTVSGGPPWSAELTTQHAGRSGRRSLEAPSCKAAADAVALIIALSIDPDSVAAGGRDARFPDRPPLASATCSSSPASPHKGASARCLERTSALASGSDWPARGGAWTCGGLTASAEIRSPSCHRALPVGSMSPPDPSRDVSTSVESRSRLDRAPSRRRGGSP